MIGLAVEPQGVAMPNSLILIFGLVGVLGALMLLLLLRRRNKLTPGSDSEPALGTLNGLGGTGH